MSSRKNRRRRKPNVGDTIVVAASFEDVRKDGGTRRVVIPTDLGDDFPDVICVANEDGSSTSFSYESTRTWRFLRRDERA